MDALLERLKRSVTPTRAIATVLSAICLSFTYFITGGGQQLVDRAEDLTLFGVSLAMFCVANFSATRSKSNSPYEELQNEKSPELFIALVLQYGGITTSIISAGYVSTQGTFEHDLLVLLSHLLSTSGVTVLTCFWVIELKRCFTTSSPDIKEPHLTTK